MQALLLRHRAVISRCAVCEWCVHPVAHSHSNCKLAACTSLAAACTSLAACTSRNAITVAFHTRSLLAHSSHIPRPSAGVGA